MELKINKKCLIIYLHLICSVFCSAERVQNLNGEWLVKEPNGKYADLKATVPGGIYSDLMRNNIIENIFYGYNDNSTKWVPRTNWTYYTNFTVEEDFINNENINIVFEGLDTFSTIFINNIEIGKSENMFVQYVFDIKNFIKPGLNTIEVKFQSPLEVAEKLYENQNKLYPIPWICPPEDYHGECHINMIRKMQASFAWDWGPSFPSVGIWKNVFLEAYNQSVVRYLVADVIEKEESWIVNIDVYFANNSKQHVVGKILCQIDLDSNFKISRIYDVDRQVDEYFEIILSTAFEVPKSHVVTWWPNGYGSQNLYNLSVQFVDLNETEKSVKSIRLGFRTVELVQGEIASGLTFYFKVNGVPIYIKGANEIPINILPEWGQNKSTIKHLLTSAHDVHMNMIRVWGGGVYESDYFYEVADELGLLIWQDFMFACSLYPANDEYLRNVVQEVRHNVKRLRSHTSVALFSGNNENEGVLANNWYGTNGNYTLYKKDYVKLYITTIKNEFVRLTHNRSLFVSSSPTNGKESETEGYVAKNPGSNFYGDVHFYNYILDPFNPNFYPIPRFASEYGYQSLPSVETLLTVTNDTKDLRPYSDFLNYRQHHPFGNLEMTLLINYNLRLPSNSNPNYYKAYILYSQIVQAESIKIETEHYRRHMSSLDNQGQGYTMGALYWQLNDVWVAPTWSSIDYTGRYKMLHYFAMNFFNPLLITGYLTLERELQLYVISDLTSPIEDITVHVRVYNWSTFEPVSDSSLTVNLTASHSLLVKTLNADDYLSSLKCGSLSEARYNCFFYFTVDLENSLNVGYNYVFPASLSASKVPLANLKISSVQKVSDDSTFTILITADSIALYVWLDSHDMRGQFSENGFLQIEENKTVRFHAYESATSKEVMKSLTVTSLKDPLYFL